MQADLSTIVIPATAKIVDALRVIDGSGLQVAVVVDADGLLKGLVTDGDVRRGLLRGLSLNVSVAEVMNAHPVTREVGAAPEVALGRIRQLGRRHLPIVDGAGKLIALEIVEAHLPPQVTYSCAVLMAGGLGKRLHPITEALPKPMITVGDQPILERLVKHLRDQGIFRFYISVNYKAEMIESYFGNGRKWGVEISYLHENVRLGTAGALGLLPEAPEGSFLLMNGDIMTSINLRQMMDYHIDHAAAMTIGAFAHEHQIPFGVLQMSGDQVTAIEEKPVIRKYVSGGVYTLSPLVLDFVRPGEVVDMPVLIQRLIESSQKVSAFPIREYWIDIGRHDDLSRALQEVQAIFPSGTV